MAASSKRRRLDSEDDLPNVFAPPAVREMDVDGAGPAGPGEESADPGEENDVDDVPIRYIKKIAKRASKSAEEQQQVIADLRKEIRTTEAALAELRRVCDPIRQRIVATGYTAKRAQQLALERDLKSANKALEVAKQMSH